MIKKYTDVKTIEKKWMSKTRYKLKAAQTYNTAMNSFSIKSTVMTGYDVFLGLYHKSTLFNSSQFFIVLKRMQLIPSERARALTKGEN